MNQFGLDRLLDENILYVVLKVHDTFKYSSIAQWQSIRLLTEGLLVRAQLGEVEVEGCARCIALYLKNEAPWSSGQDIALSRR